MKKIDLREYGFNVGQLPLGKNNDICDVKKVKVGSVTLIKGEGKLQQGKGPVRTGVTVILPHSSNVFEEKVAASCFVMNGYGKSFGLIQISELGIIESPIAITNTLNVPIVADALIDYSIMENRNIGINTSTVNVVVGECNDSFLNDIQGRHVKKEHVFEAIEKASNTVEQGCVGAGTGMMCMGFKSGVGSSSRIIETREKDYIVGVLVVPNFGLPGDLTFLSRRIVPQQQKKDLPKDGGSIIVVLATDAPMTARQLYRLSKRVPLGIARTGGYATHGSGDIVISFSNVVRFKHNDKQIERSISIINEGSKTFNQLIKGTIEATQEAIYNALLNAKSMTGRDNHIAEALSIQTLINKSHN